MRIILFAAALSVSGFALAQAAPEPTPTQPAPAQPAPTQPTTDQPSGVTTTDGTVPGDGVTQQGTDPGGVAVPPPGANMPPPPGPVAVPINQNAPFTPQPATQSYPPCSKTVTDRCTQTYEKGVRRRR